MIRSQQEGISQHRRSSVYHLARSVKKSLRKRVSVKTRNNFEESFDDILTNEEEVEAISHIGNLRRKPSVVRYGSRGARKFRLDLD